VNTATSGTGAVRVIKKYPNRRLYDTAESRYVTFDHIRGLVYAGVQFIVVERWSQLDVTNDVLMQTIVEQERKLPRLNKQFLLGLILEQRS